MKPETLRLCQQVIRLSKGIISAFEEWVRATVARGSGGPSQEL